MNDDEDARNDGHMTIDELRGKVALVTGGSRGIGRAVAIALAHEGASLALCFREDEDAASDTRRMIEAYGVHCIAVRADVSRR